MLKRWASVERPRINQATLSFLLLLTQQYASKMAVRWRQARVGVAPSSSYIEFSDVNMLFIASLRGASYPPIYCRPLGVSRWERYETLVKVQLDCHQCSYIWVWSTVLTISWNTTHQCIHSPVRLIIILNQSVLEFGAKRRHKKKQTNKDYVHSYIFMFLYHVTDIVCKQTDDHSAWLEDPVRWSH